MAYCVLCEIQSRVTNLNNLKLYRLNKVECDIKQNNTLFVNNYTNYSLKITFFVKLNSLIMTILLNTF